VRRNLGTSRPAKLAAFVIGSALAVSALPLASAGATTTASSKASLTAKVAHTAAAASPTRGRSALYGAGYLARQIKAGDGALSPFGAPDVTDTAYAVLGLHATHVGAGASKAAIAFLKKQVKSGLAGSDGKDDPGALGYVIMAAVTAGSNPRAFGGHAKRNNLVARLLKTTRTKGKDKGLFGSADPTFDGAFRQGVALSALKAAKIAKSRVAKNIHWLEHQQCSNGLWTSYRTKTSVACPKVDFTTFTGPDTNSTGSAAQGLAAYRLHPRKTKLLAKFRSIQSADGGFPFLAAAGQTSDPDSTALSIQAVRSQGVGVTLSRYKIGSKTPYTALQSYQLGCSDPAADRGGFFYPGSRTANVLATVQAVPALTGKTLPLTKSVVVGLSPQPTCSTASPAPAKAPAAAASAKATPKVAGTAGACKGTTGVTVAVDFTAFSGGKVQVRCAPGKPATGVAALQQAGFTPAGTTKYGLAFICRINSKPSTTAQTCVSTPPATSSWSYYHASHTATAWTYSTLGASSYKPAQGSVQGWAFGNKAKVSKTPAQVRATKS
jgi:hypothetical protein